MSTKPKRISDRDIIALMGPIHYASKDMKPKKCSTPRDKARERWLKSGDGEMVVSILSVPTAVLQNRIETAFNSGYDAGRRAKR